MAGLLAACGTDFVEPAAAGVRVETPTPQATVFRVIPVTPVATATPPPLAVGPDGSVQRLFPAEIDPSRTGAGLPSDVVISFWTEYLSDTRLIVADSRIDAHLCADGSLLPGSASSIVPAGAWGLRPASGEWYEVILGSENRSGRISGFTTLSRAGASTVALNDGVAVVSVTDSDLCADLGGF